MKKNIIIIVAITTISILGLFIWAKLKEKGNDFERNYLTTIKIKERKSIEVNDGANRLDIFNGELYLQNINNNNIIKIKENRENIFFNYGILLNEIIPENYSIINDSIFFSCPSKRAVYKSGLKGKENLSIEKFKIPFSRSIKIDNGFILKNCLDNLCENEQFTMFQSNKVIGNFDVIKHRNDGGMSQDGFFIKGENKTFFISYILPHIFCFDKKGKYISKFNTIDNREIEPEVIKLKKGAYTFKGNPYYQQLTASISGNTLYILSNLSDNKINSSDGIVDMYDTAKEKYIGSFTLPKKHGTRFFDFKIMKNTLFILYSNNELVTYDFNHLI
ncbi:MAG: hypothetical protein QM564_01420 [Bergeyella sp.]